MERIQSAISKARAARQGRPGTEARDPAPRTGAPAPAAAEVDAAWAALEEIRPDPALLERGRIVSLSGGPAALPFDMMRTRVLQQMRASGWRRLAITSPGSACGKTMTCLNLAFSLGRQPELRTLVIEADLRRPSMARALGLKVRHHFSAVLEGADPAARHLVRHGASLAFGTSHQPAKNPAELLHGSGIGAVLAGIETEFAPDLTIFDMPPMHAGDDTIAFLGNMDCALLVAAAGETTVEEIDVCEQELASRTNMLGVVLNKCRYLDRSQGHGYEYGYGS